MAFLLAHVTVKDPANWRLEYDEIESAYRGKGVVGSRVFRNVDNPNELVLLVEWTNVEQARGFVRAQHGQRTNSFSFSSYLMDEPLT